MENSFKCQADAPNTLLIVDDDEMNREVLANIFAAAHSIETAENGREGLDKLRMRRREVCAVLLDVVMPVMGGIAMLEELGRENVVNQIPVFLITGETDDRVIKKAYDLGVMDVIPKPVSPHIVRRRVNSVIELFVARERFADIVDRQKAEIQRQAERILKLNMGLIASLATAIEFRSGESGEHVRRIHDITSLFLTSSPLGEGFSEDAIEQISLAAIMHDVGKISVPDAILNKPGRLTGEEFDIMKTHTTEGCRLLAQIPQMRELPFFECAYDIARHHHERWDGGGYPDGLRGGDISLWAQIVSIADVYDALVSKRVYKEAYGCDKAVEMISGGACGVFNPRLLECFQAIEGRIRNLYLTGAADAGE